MKTTQQQYDEQFALFTNDLNAAGIDASHGPAMACVNWCRANGIVGNTLRDSIALVSHKHNLASGLEVLRLERVLREENA